MMKLLQPFFFKSALGSKNLDSSRLKFVTGSKTGVPSWTPDIKKSPGEVGFKAIYVVGRVQLRCDGRR
jgi:hypothetical protein